jgi:radical SAM protein with 4Fe4S-binding SPASM domain
MISNGDYPVLDVVKIHLTPRGGYIFKKTDTLNMRKELVFRHNMTTLNTSACKLLVLCNGERKVEEIVKFVCESENDNSQPFVKGIYVFLEEAKRRNHITISDKPEPAKMSTTGSIDIFYPIHISLELTTRCNMMCKHCYRNAGYGGRDWDTQSLKRILLKFKSKGLRFLEITGGEPTVHPDFLNIIDFCSKQFDLTGILTNGYLMDESMVNKLSNYKDKLMVCVSLDGSTAEKHESFRGVKSFYRVTRAVKLLSGSGILVRTSMSVTPENFDDIESTLLLAKKLGADIFGYSPAISVGRGKDAFKVGEVTPEKSREMVETEDYIQRTYADFLQLVPENYLKDLFKEQLNCGAGYKNIALDPDGNVRACVMWPTSQIIGNVIEEPLEKVFSNQQVNYLSKLTPPNDETCGECERRLYCRHCNARGLYSYLEGHECNWATRNSIEKNLNFKGD